MDARVATVLGIVHGRSGDTNLSVHALSDDLRLSTHYLGQLFRRHTGVTFRRYLRDVRIAAACEMLRDVSHSIKEVAALAGYTNTANFDRDFRLARGVTPGEFRQLLFRG